MGISCGVSELRQESDSRGTSAIGATVSPIVPSSSRSIRVELDGQRITSDSITWLLREALDNSCMIASLEHHLADPRDPPRVRHLLANQVLTVVTQGAMGWYDANDTDTLRLDPL